MFVMIEEMLYAIQDGKATILIVLRQFVFLQVKVNYPSQYDRFCLWSISYEFLILMYWKITKVVMLSMVDVLHPMYAHVTMVGQDLDVANVFHYRDVNTVIVSRKRSNVYVMIHLDGQGHFVTNVGNDILKKYHI